MKNIILTIALFSMCLSVYAQNGPTQMSFYKNGSLVDHKLVTDLDSVVFSVLPPFSLYYPQNGDTGVTVFPTLKPYGYDGAKSYTVQLSTDSNFSILVANYSWLANTFYPSNQFELYPYTVYYWRAGAVLSSYTTVWSPTYHFTTAWVDLSVCNKQITYAGKTYNTVMIGQQCWIKENMNVGTFINISQASSDNGILEKYCYNDDSTNCSIFGGLYDRNEIEYQDRISDLRVCPSGWHIPSHDEYQVLFNNINDDTTLMGKSGFQSLYGGKGFLGGGFGELGDYGTYWSSGAIGYMYYCAGFYSGTNGGGFTYYPLSAEDYALSVRCVQDVPLMKKIKPK